MDLSRHGLTQVGKVHANLSAAALVEEAVRRGEAVLASNGALNAHTGKRTGRSPRDRFIAADPGVREQIAWGKVNQPMEPAAFARLADKTRQYLRGKELFVFDGWACADPRHRLSVRVITEKAWHSL